MIDLTPSQSALLRRIIAAGADGLRYAELPQVDAMRLALNGLVEIGLSFPRLTIATEKGRAFSLRGVS